MDRVYKRLLDIMCRDDGGRGFSSNAPAADVDALRHALEITNNVAFLLRLRTGTSAARRTAQ